MYTVCLLNCCKIVHLFILTTTALQDQKLSKVSLVYGQMNEPPGARARVCLTGLTVAEFFRDHEGQDVLLFIDNIFRFTQAGSEVRADDVFWRIRAFNCHWIIQNLM